MKLEVGDYVYFSKYIKIKITFNRIATAHNWTPARCTQILPLYLQGSALAIYESMPGDQKSRWKTLVEGLSGMLKKISNKESARRKLVERRQEMGEGLEEFARDLMNLVEAAYPENAFGMELDSIKLNDEQRTGLKEENDKMVKRFKEEICMERFKAGLLPELREKVIFMKAPSSLAEAIAQAKRVDELNSTIKAETRKRLEKIEVKAALAEVNEVCDPCQNDAQYYYEKQFMESNGCSENWGEDDKNWDSEQMDQYYDDEGQWFPHGSNEDWGEEYCQDQGYQNCPMDGTDFEKY
uniref:Uncharacterized protein n=1 Tax=Meloidogyne enterolobii TaxID=390850 RepID=A0A6V7WV96_MELEN|nr:unnamed protein product [Meloidogyne enterolobii]